MRNRRASKLLPVVTATLLLAGWCLRKRHRRRLICEEATYLLNTQRASLLSAIFLVADAIAIPLILRGKQDLDTAELELVNRSFVPWFDRHALNFDPLHRETYRKISDRYLQFLLLLPAMLLFNHRAQREWKAIGALYAWTQALTYTLYSFSPLGPAFIDKYRPVVFYDMPDPKDQVSGNNRNARFSGHTAAATAATFFLVTVYHHLTPGRSRVERGLDYLLAFGAALSLGWLRMKSLKHFPSDVLQAMVIGAAAGRLIPQLYLCTPPDTRRMGNASVRS